jgi:Na+-transporting methylmalonyl-CoA/oxaloacetate decarboxylase gamma subunit
LSSILEGLRLSLAGILITFLYFGLLILVMVLLREIFKVPSQDKKPDKLNTDQDIDRMKAAGIAVVVAIKKSKKQSGASLGQVLENPPGRWWRDARNKEKNG